MDRQPKKNIRPPLSVVISRSICTTLLFLAALLSPTHAGSQTLLPLMEPKDYQEFLEDPMLTRGGATSTVFKPAFKYLDSYNFDRTHDELDRIIKQANNANEKLQEGLARDFQGLVYQREGKLGFAKQSHERAAAILKNLENIGVDGWANATNHLAIATYTGGEYQDALALLNPIIENKDLGRLTRARARNNRGLLHQELGNLESARTDFALSASDARDDKKLQAQIINNEARVRVIEGDHRYTVALIAEAQTLARDAKDPVLEANILDSWGEILIRAKRHDEALMKLTEAEKIIKNSQGVLVDLSVRWNRGRALALAGKSADALAAFNDVIKRAANLCQAAQWCLPVMEREARTSRADLFMQIGKLSEAIIDYEKAVEIVQGSRSRLPNQSEKEFIAATQGLYEKLVKALVKRKQTGDIDKALAYIYQSKSDALHRDLIKATPELRDKDLQNRVNGARGFLDQEAALILLYQQALTKTPAATKDELADLQKRLENARKNASLAYQEIKNRDGEQFSALVNISPLALVNLKETLSDGQLLVAFLPTDDGLYFFLASKQSGVEFRQNPNLKRKDLLDKVTKYRTLITRVSGSRSDWNINSWRDPRWKSLSAATTELYDAILQPIQDRINVAKQVTFAPTGMLYYLPLHALGPVDVKSGEIRFLIQDKPVNYLTTATLRFTKDVRAPSGSLFALANPIFKHDEPKLDQLKEADLEADALKEFFGSKNSVVLKGREATRATLLATLGALGPKARHEEFAKRGGAPNPNANFGFVHMATHGVLNAKEPNKSWLALEGTSRLLAQEIPKLDLRNVSLVTLSACETGLAEEKPGGELMNMATFFSQAGAPSIAVTLWKVDDKETRELMVEFYRNLIERNLNKSRALQEAQKSLLSKAESRHPFFWSAFILVGDWQ